MHVLCSALAQHLHLGKAREDYNSSTAEDGGVSWSYSVGTWQKLHVLDLGRPKRKTTPAGTPFVCLIVLSVTENLIHHYHRGWCKLGLHKLSFSLIRSFSPSSLFWQPNRQSAFSSSPTGLNAGLYNNWYGVYFD